jgi:osmotically-inducible protein OsmY
MDPFRFKEFKEMKTIFTVLSVILGAAFVLQFTTSQAKGSEALSTPAAPKAAVLKPATLPRASQTSDEFSRPFQVSSDSRDQVQLSIRNGIVTIKGSVATEELAQRLVKQYGHISGVRAVRNRLTVRSNRDSEIAARVREVFSRDQTTHSGGIAVTVYGGIVFLSGAVASEEESTHAEELARALPGVTRVNNGLRTPASSRYSAQLARARTITRIR